MDCPALISIFHTPKIMWYQTDNTIIIRVMLQDVKDYFLRIEADHLRFRYKRFNNKREGYKLVYIVIESMLIVEREKKMIMG